MSDRVSFTAPLRIWTNDSENSSVGYVTIPGETAEVIRAHELMRRLELGKRRGFGSVKVVVHLGEHSWPTSVFPQKDGTWFCPIKVQYRRAEGLEEGDPASVELELL
ncbi:MAG: hypothetical protein RLZZ08_1500 [Pseudomonadota bacterium]|jgi:hypothetical protein